MVAMALEQEFENTNSSEFPVSWRTQCVSEWESATNNSCPWTRRKKQSTVTHKRQLVPTALRKCRGTAKGLAVEKGTSGHSAHVPGPPGAQVTEVKCCPRTSTPLSSSGGAVRGPSLLQLQH